MKTRKTLTLFTIATFLLFAGCKKDLYLENPGLCPVVKSTSPIDGAVLVPRGQKISVAFNKKMDPATINQDAFSFTASPKLTGTMTYDADSYTMSFVPDVPLAKNTTYTGKVFTTVEDLNGNALQQEYLWTFSTDNFISPTVFCTDPQDGAIDVPVNIVVKACFSMDMDPTTVNSSTFTLKEGANSVSGSITYSDSIAYFEPDANLLPNKEYTATLTTGLENSVGKPLLSNHVWRFTTSNKVAPYVTGTSPTPDEQNVYLAKEVRANFSDEMDPLTLNSQSFLVLNGSDTISGTVSYAAFTATFSPSTNLVSGKTYKAIITTGALDKSGTALLTQHAWSFKTKQVMGSNAVDLGSVARFGIFSALGIENQAGASQINNLDVGISPGSYVSVTGFPPAVINNGNVYAMDDSDPSVPVMLVQAKADLQNAYDSARVAQMPAPATVNGDLGGQTLAPGIYKSTSTLLVQSGNLTLDAQGDINATWIFQISSDLTTVGGAGGSIILKGGANPENIFWQVGSSATIGDYTQFKGNILAHTSINMNPYSVIEGRVLCLNGSVVMASTNTINKP